MAELHLRGNKMNVSDTTNGSRMTDDESARQTTLAIFVLTFVFGSTGNLLVLLVVAKKHSRSINDIFIVHLAISDLSFILLCLPVFIYMQVSTFQGSLVYCKIIWPMMTVSFCAGIFTVTHMAVHRCKAILRPFESTLQKRQLIVCFLYWYGFFPFLSPFRWSSLLRSAHRELVTRIGQQPTTNESTPQCLPDYSTSSH